MKKILLNAVLASVAMVATSASYAAADGFYTGIQLGAANTNYDKQDFIGTGQGMTTTAVDSVDNTGFGGRAFFGYQFNPNFALEAGYTYFPETDANGVVSTNNSTGATAIGRADLKEYAVDIAAKPILPVTQNMDVYAKLGAAYVHTSTGGYSIIDDTSRVRPEYGAGISYDLTPSVPVFIEATRIQRISDGVDNADLLSAGIAYHFG